MYGRQDGSAIGAVLGLFVVAGIIGAALYASAQNEKAWRAYADEHHCYVVSTREARSRSAVMTVDGKLATGATTEPGETCWACDPGPRGVSVCR